MMTLTDTRPLSDEALRKAIELRCSDAFAAMNLANSLGGYQSDEWRAVREYSFTQLVDEAYARKLPVEEFQASLMKEDPDPRPITQTRLWTAYRKAKEIRP